MANNSFLPEDIDKIKKAQPGFEAMLEVYDNLVVAGEEFADSTNVEKMNSDQKIVTEKVIALKKTMEEVIEGCMTAMQAIKKIAEATGNM